MGFDEAKEPIVRILVVVSASDPKVEPIVFDRNDPAPVFCVSIATRK